MQRHLVSRQDCQQSADGFCRKEHAFSASKPTRFNRGYGQFSRQPKLSRTVALRVALNRRAHMWLLLFIAIAALIIGNWLRKIGVEEARANPYGSAASLAGQRKSGLGTWLNILGGICVVAAVVLQWP